MNESTIKHLDSVLFLLREQRKEIRAIQQQSFRRIGLQIVQLTADDKTEMIRQAQSKYRRLIKSIYQKANHELEAGGCETLKNPFI